MFIEARILACIEHLKDAAKDVQKFESPTFKSTQAGIRTRKTLKKVSDDLISIRAEIMAVRKKRIAAGEKKY